MEATHATCTLESRPFFCRSPKLSTRNITCYVRDVGSSHAPASRKQELKTSIVWDGRRDHVVVAAKVFFGGLGFILRRVARDFRRSNQKELIEPGENVNNSRGIFAQGRYGSCYEMQIWVKREYSVRVLARCTTGYFLPTQRLKQHRNPSNQAPCVALARCSGGKPATKPSAKSLQTESGAWQPETTSGCFVASNASMI